MLIYIAVGLFCVAFVLTFVKYARPTRSIAHVLYEVENPLEKR
jgi:hypothetical protein